MDYIHYKLSVHSGITTLESSAFLLFCYIFESSFCGGKRKKQEIKSLANNWGDFLVNFEVLPISSSHYLILASFFFFF